MPARRGGCPALGHVVALVGVSAVEGGDDAPVDGPDVAVPRSGLDVLSCAVDDGIGVLGVISVVIVRPDLGVEACRAKSRAHEIPGDAGGLVLVLPHGDVAAALVVQRLVLNRDGVDGDAVAGVGSKILNKVSRISAIVLRVKLVPLS